MPGRPLPRARSCFRSPTNTLHRAHASTRVRGDALGPVVSDALQTFHVRHDGSKLPLPPVLDPIVVAQRSRWKQQKAQPDVASFTPFQKRLWETPSAHVLASPIRVDRSLSTLLPSALLLTLHIKPHPTTLEPWLLPLSLSTPNPPKFLGPPVRFLAHRLNAAYLTTRKHVWKKALAPRALPLLGPRGMAQMVWRKDMPELLLDMLRARVEDKLGWWFKWRGRLIPIASPSPSDTQEVDDVACVLLYGSLKTRADEVLSEANDMVAEADKWTSYFRGGFGKYFDAHVSPPANMPKATHHPPSWYEPLVPQLLPRAQFPPLEFPTTKWRGRKVALYSLTDMLGADRAAALVEGTQYDEGRCWVMKRGRQAVGVQLLLGQLQSYLAESGAVWWPR